MGKEFDFYPEKVEQMLASIKLFCKKKLNKEYYKLCRELLNELYMDNDFNLERGNQNIWAAAIVGAIGAINYLFDKGFKPYISLDELCEYFEVNKSSVTNKSINIRKTLNIHIFNSLYSTDYVLEKNPFKEYVIVGKSLMLLEAFSQDVQEQVREARQLYPDVILKRDKKKENLLHITPATKEIYDLYKAFIDPWDKYFKTLDAVVSNIKMSIMAKMLMANVNKLRDLAEKPK